MPTIESKQIVIRAEILGETDNSYLLFDGKRQVWPPKDFVAYDEPRGWGNTNEPAEGKDLWAAR